MIIIEAALRFEVNDLFHEGILCKFSWIHFRSVVPARDTAEGRLLCGGRLCGHRCRRNGRLKRTQCSHLFDEKRKDGIK